MYISCLDRGNKRDRARMGEYNREKTAHKLKTAAAEIKELDEEADRLCNTLEKIVADKKKQDFHLRLLKGEVERRKTNPLGFRLGPSPQEVKEKREREAEEKAKEEHRMQEQRERRLRRELAEQIERQKELVKEKERRVKAGRGAQAANERINERPIPAEIWAAATAIAASRGRELPIGSDVLAAYRKAHCSRRIGAEH